MTDRTFRRASTLAALAACFVSAAAAQRAASCALQPEHAAILVMQVPAAVASKAKGGCPAADHQERDAGLAGFTVRNLCSSGGNGVLGTYLVELSSGVVREEATGQTVDSPALRTTRTRVCSMSVRGVLPSLLPHARTRTRRTVRQ